MKLVDFSKLPEFFKKRYRLKDRIHNHLIVPFDPNPPQVKFLQTCGTLQRRGDLVWVIVLKPRRVGISRIVAGVGSTLAYAYPGLKGNVMAHKGATLHEIMLSYQLMMSGLPLPKDLKPSYTPLAPSGSQVVNNLILYKGRRASQIVGSKALATGAGRGSEGLFQQLTEAAYYPQNSPFTSMLPVLPRAPHSFVCIESTPNGMSGPGEAFYRTWQEARWIHESRRDVLFTRFFSPWFDDPVNRAREAAKGPYAEDEKALIKAGVDKFQLSWRRSEIRSRYQGNIELFNQENPASPEEAFLSSSLPAFTEGERLLAQRGVEDPKMVGSFNMELYERRGEIRFIRQEHKGLWQIWEEPKQACEYYMGVDPARGIDSTLVDASSSRQIAGDYCAIVIINGTRNTVAAVLEARIRPDEAAAQADIAGRWYSTPELGRQHFALCNVELNAGYGAECQRRMLQERNYPRYRMYRWKGRDDKLHRKPSISLGSTTTPSAREMYLSALRSGLGVKGLKVNSERLAEQIAQAEMINDGARITRGHDDVLYAAMLAWIGREMYPPRWHIEPERPIQIVRSLPGAHADPDAMQAQLWEGLTRRGDKGRPWEGVVYNINNARG